MTEKKKPSAELESLNMDDLDIEELERRIELASTIPISPDVWSCDTYCPNLECREHSVEQL